MSLGISECHNVDQFGLFLEAATTCHAMECIIKFLLISLQK